MTDWRIRPREADLRAFVGSRRQLGSVRRIVLDDGPERGLAAIAFSTGGGLDFWVLAGRAMDIGPLWSGGAPVAWLGPAGLVHPSLIDVEGDGGRGFERGFSGFLHTCGLDHTRQPAGGYPLHGRLPFLPARIIGAGEDWQAAEPVLWCEGEIVQWRLGAESLRLVRRIEAPIGGREIRLQDRLENIGLTPQRIALLYHINLGFPAIGPGTTVSLDNATVFGPLCPPDALGTPMVVGRPAVGETAVCRVTGASDASARTMQVEFHTDTLPHLQMWHDPRPATYVLAVEPCSASRAPTGQLADEPMLDTGERRDMRIRIAFE